LLIALVVRILVLYELLCKLALVIYISISLLVGFAFTNNSITLPIIYIYSLLKFKKVIRVRYTTGSINYPRLYYILQLEVV
jgi:hypothetical protein